MINLARVGNYYEPITNYRNISSNIDGCPSIAFIFGYYTMHRNSKLHREHNSLHLRPRNPTAQNQHNTPTPRLQDRSQNTPNHSRNHSETHHRKRHRDPSLRHQRINQRLPNIPRPNRPRNQPRQPRLGTLDPQPRPRPLFLHPRVGKRGHPRRRTPGHRKRRALNKRHHPPLPHLHGPSHQRRHAPQN